MIESTFLMIISTVLPGTWAVLLAGTKNQIKQEPFQIIVAKSKQLDSFPARSQSTIDNYLFVIISHWFVCLNHSHKAVRGGRS